MLLFNKASQAKPVPPAVKWILGILFLTGILSTGTLPRENWPAILIPFSIAFGIYAYLLGRNHKTDLRFWLAIAIISRLVLTFTFPNLSDDVYRFIWDGHASLQGFDPFTIVPVDHMAQHGESGALNYALFENLNSTINHTVYPPILQWIFTFSAYVGGANWHISAIVLKLFILFAELGSILLLYRYFTRIDRPGLTLIYALNPLVIIELVGNIHFEGIMIFGLVLAITTLAASTPVKRIANTSIIGGLSLSIGVKLLPLIALPYLLRRMSLRRFAIITGGTLMIVLLTFIPMLNIESGSGMLSSLNLYFQKFEFNASIYYILRWFGYLWKGYNMIATIGIVTAGITIAIMLSLFLFEPKPSRQNYPHILLFAFATYLFLTSIVHPWYICVLIMLSAFTRFRFAIVWSAMIFLSYATYRTDAYQENLWLVALEYVTVFSVLLYELVERQNKANSTLL